MGTHEFSPSKRSAGLPAWPTQCGAASPGAVAVKMEVLEEAGPPGRARQPQVDIADAQLLTLLQGRATAAVVGAPRGQPGPSLPIQSMPPSTSQTLLNALLLCSCIVSRRKTSCGEAAKPQHGLQRWKQEGAPVCTPSRRHKHNSSDRRRGLGGGGSAGSESPLALASLQPATLAL